MRNAIALITSLMLVALLLTGCGKDSKSEEGQGSAAQAPAKALEQYRQEADREITTENVEQELEKLEKEIDADAAAE